MATSYVTQGYIQITGVTFNGTEGAAGSSLNWTGTNGFNDDLNIIDDNDDNNLDNPQDYFIVTTVPFTGYTVTGTDGTEYGVFKNSIGEYFIALPVDGVGQTIINSSGTSNTYQAETANTVYLCFAAGTLISTPTGQRSVETLSIGDPVLTADGRSVPVKWIGRQTLSKFRHGPRMQPVRIRAGALGDGLPHSDLTVTADHGMIIDDLVINAAALVNGTTIDFVPMAELENRFTVYHIETEAHDIILANGAASETFLDAAGRAAFDNHDEYLALYGADRIIMEMNRPRITTSRLVPDDIKARLAGGQDQITQAVSAA